MKKIIEISFEFSYKILCIFNNGENRILDLEKVLDKEGKYSKKIFENETFRQAKIDSFGGNCWEGVAEIRNLKGEIEPCEYDMSPKWVYRNSVSLKTEMI